MTPRTVRRDREQLGGYYLVDAKHGGGARECAKRVPGAEAGSVEVRPIKVRLIGAAKAARSQDRKAPGGLSSGTAWNRGSAPINRRVFREDTGASSRLMRLLGDFDRRGAPPRGVRDALAHWPRDGIRARGPRMAARTARNKAIDGSAGVHDERSFRESEKSAELERKTLPWLDRAGDRATIGCG